MNKKIFGRPLVLHRIFVEITGDIKTALLLSQACYWSQRTNDEDGWFWKTGEEWEEETGLTRKEQERARKELKELSLMSETLRGLPAKMYYRVEWEKVYELSGDTRPQYVQKEQTGMTKTGEHSISSTTTDKIEDEENEKDLCYFGFTLPAGWKEVNLGFDSDNADEPNVYLKNEWGEKVKQSEIKKRRVQYQASQKARVTREKHADPIARDMVETLKSEQELTYLDGGDNLKHAVAFKIKFCEHLVKDMGIDSSQLESRVLANFRAFLGRVRGASQFHWKNMTNFGYMDRNFNKIIRDLK